MRYLCSDIHGDYFGFLKLLDCISFDESSDHIFILGDIIDRGDYSKEMLKLVIDKVNQGSMTLIKGNHELFMEMYLNGNLTKGRWINWGGKNNFIDYIDSLNDIDKKELLEFISSLPHYIEIAESPLGRTILTHSGVCEAYCDIDKSGKVNVARAITRAMEDEFTALISRDLHYIGQELLNKFDAYLIVGHVPCNFLTMSGACRIIKNPYYMDIDTGAGFEGGGVSAYCLDNGKEYYC